MARKRSAVLTREQRRRYADVLAIVPSEVIAEFDARLMRALARDRAYVASLHLRPARHRQI